MKQFNIILLLLAVVFSACEKDETMMKMASEPTAASITSQSDGFSAEIKSDNLDETIDFAWTGADYGVNTQITYVLQVDLADRNFASPAVLATTTDESATLRLTDLNSRLLNDLEVSANETSALQLRVVASVNNKFTVISDVINISVKTYKDVTAKPATLWVPGGYQGWNPAVAPVIYATGPKTFEGYVYIKEGTGFKFTSDPDWNHINYGDSGTPNLLTTDGAANGMSASEPGYYRFKVNIETLEYEMIRVTTWGIIGTATPGNWDSSTAMAYDQAKDTWSVTVDLKAGALKFRANNDWGLNYGPFDTNALAGQLIQTDGAISIPADGNYTVTIDLSRSKSPYEYAYTVKKN